MHNSRLNNGSVLPAQPDVASLPLIKAIDLATEIASYSYSLGKGSSTRGFLSGFPALSQEPPMAFIILNFKAIILPH